MARTSYRSTYSSIPYSLCGCYYFVHTAISEFEREKLYLPLVESTVHSTILSTTSRTVLTQTFTNPSEVEAIKSCLYTFPLYDGVSVVSFTCRIGSKTLTGLVKEKAKAKKTFDDAVAKGETAGLLEQSQEAADVFTTKLGNIPAKESIVVEIIYVGELKHTETEGIRFTIPTSIAPRYGAGPAVNYTSSKASAVNGIKITVDISMPEGSHIKSVQSPSHPIAVSLGTLSTASNADPSLSKASGTLSLGSAALEKDFVLIVSAKDIGTPKAILETHPTLPNHRALMATLVPKFSLPPARPEIVFVADRSGSMSGNIDMLKSAMTVFLKSVPVGVKFNICSFGSSHSFLWTKSKAYSAETLAEATAHVATFSANLGGTETFNAIKATIDRRFTDLPLEVILLTDGDIWSQEVLFEYVNKQVVDTKGQIRIFPLGIGSGVSHSLIEGLARAGNGFASAVQDGERLDNAVVRMLRGALSPHITDYTIEVKYGKNNDKMQDVEPTTDDDNDDFEHVEKVTDGMQVLVLDDNKKRKQSSVPISLFDSSVDPEKDPINANKDAHAHLPEVPYPRLQQAPHAIPTLFSFSRTSVYLLLSPETYQQVPTSVILRATSEHGPLALEIPVEVLKKSDTTIHQLAAKKAVQDLEEGRGWIYDAKDQNGKLIKERYASSFSELVEKEAVRLGEKFQIAGKWTSFVAVAANDKQSKESRSEDLNASDDDYDNAMVYNNSPPPGYGESNSVQRRSIGGMAPRKQLASKAARRSAPSTSGWGAVKVAPPPPPAPLSSPELQSFSLRGEQDPNIVRRSERVAERSHNFAMKKSSGGGITAAVKGLGGMFGSASRSLASTSSDNSRASASHRAVTQESVAQPAFGQSQQQQQQQLQQLQKEMSASASCPIIEDTAMSYAPTPPVTLFGSSRPSPGGPTTSVKVHWTQKSDVERLHALIALQSFEGNWAPSAELASILGVSLDDLNAGTDSEGWCTTVVIKVLETKMADEEGTWGLVVEKAKGWLSGVGLSTDVEKNAALLVDQKWN